MRALLIVDMSNDFISDDGSLSLKKQGQVLVPHIMKHIEEFKDDIIVFCNDTHNEDDEHFKLWPKHNVVNTKGIELYGDLKNYYDQHKNDMNVYYVKKSEYDAFYKTELNDILKALKIQDVYVTGVCTDICIFNTVYGAYKEGFNTYVFKDAVATFTNNQEIFLKHMENIYKTKII